VISDAETTGNSGSGVSRCRTEMLLGICAEKFSCGPTANPKILPNLWCGLLEPFFQHRMGQVQRQTICKRSLDLFTVAASGNHLVDFGRVRLLRRTPGPPSSSSMNSTPAASKARRMAMSFGVVIDVSVSASSARRMVATPTADSRARSSARHRRNARAALIWPLVRGLGFMLTSRILYDIAHIVQY
jgi:hypothetical protein